MGICAFRLDDITPDMNWENFNRICSIFDKYQVKPLLGVVPDNCDKKLHMEESRTDFWECMRLLQEKGYSMAQHGYRHIYETKDSGILGLKNASEFAGLSYEEQFGKIQNGRQILQKEGIYVTIFMAPGHTFDKNTLAALVSNGFHYITDGYADRCYRYRGVTFIPSKSSKPALGKGIDTICLHMNHMSAEDMTQLDLFIKKHREDIVDYKELLAIHAAGKTLFVSCNEQKNLVFRRIKKAVSENPVAHEWMVKTSSGTKYQKLWRRVAGMPYLAAVLLFYNKDRKRKK